MLSRSLSALVDYVMPQATEGDAVILYHAALELIERKIAEMAIVMRCVVGILALGFEFSALLTVGRRFSKASPAQRFRHAKCVEAWPIIPFRELIRLVRSFTLMAFYDHPLTRHTMGFHPGGDKRS